MVTIHKQREHNLTPDVVAARVEDLMRNADLNVVERKPNEVLAERMGISGTAKWTDTTIDVEITLPLTFAFFKTRASDMLDRELDKLVGDTPA